MNGLKLAKEYYLEYGKPMLEKEFPQYIDRIAVGLVGHGSECFGYDDETSYDHDYGPGFCLWINEKDDEEFGFKLFRAYRALPDEYKGIKIKDKSLFGSNCKGVKIIKDFYAFYTGSGDVPKTLKHWLAIPDYYLAEATNGEVFADPCGEFTRIRNELKNRPDDIRLKKLSECLFAMAQYGQYNYARCLKHNEYASAALCLSEYSKYCCEAIYHLNKEYMPYYKWQYKGLEKLAILSDLKDELIELLREPYNEEKNIKILEELSSRIIKELKRQGLSKRDDDYLEPYAYDVRDKIKDNELRSMPPIR